MNTVSAVELIEDVAALMGWRSDDLDDQQFADIRNALSASLQAVWEERDSWWPETMEEQHLALYSYWSATTNYVAGDVVYFPDSEAYWQCTGATITTAPATYNSTTGEWEATAKWYECSFDTGEDAEEWEPTTAYTTGDEIWFDDILWVAVSSASAGQSPRTHPAKWQELVEFEPVLVYDRDGTADASEPPFIGAVKSINKYQPSRYGEPSPYEFTAGDNQWSIFNLDQTKVWVEYRKLFCPLVGDDYDATESYSAVTNRY